MYICIIFSHILFYAIFLAQVIYYSYQRHLFCIFGDKSLILLFSPLCLCFVYKYIQTQNLPLPIS